MTASAASSVSVAPHVLLRLMQVALRAVPGVAQLARVPAPIAPGAHTAEGIVLYPDASSVAASCYVIAANGVNLLELGLAIQATLAASVQDLAGMTVREINVFIQDVEINRG